MKRLVVLFGMAAWAFLLTCAPHSAEARPQYLKAFTAKYSEVKEQAGEQQKCAVCHGGPKGKSAKIRNDYAQALDKALKEAMNDKEAKNIKDVEKINAALDAVAKVKYKDDQTYGDLLKSGKLPDPAPEK
jgi:hypothetical protein